MTPTRRNNDAETVNRNNVSTANSDVVNNVNGLNNGEILHNHE